MGAHRLADLPVIGAMRPIDGGAAFARAQPVYRLPSGRILRTTSFPDSESVDGAFLDGGDWPELVECHEACELPGLAAPGVPISVWILRPHGPPRWRDLALAGLEHRRAEVWRWATGGTIICLVLRDQEATCLAALAAVCGGEVDSATEQRNWVGALPWADLAMLASPEPTPERFGRLIGLMRACGQPEKADGWLCLVRNSLGKDFAEATGRIADGTAR